MMGCAFPFVRCECGFIHIKEQLEAACATEVMQLDSYEVIAIARSGMNPVDVTGFAIYGGESGCDDVQDGLGS